MPMPKTKPDYFRMLKAYTVQEIAEELWRIADSEDPIDEIQELAKDLEEHKDTKLELEYGES